MLIGSIPWTPDFRRTGVFPLGTGEIGTISLARVLATPPVLKASAFGSPRDAWLIEHLERSFPTLREALASLGIGPRNRGQGFKVRGDKKPAPDDYFELPVVKPGLFAPFRLDPRTLAVFDHATLHRPPPAFHIPWTAVDLPNSQLSSRRRTRSL